MLWTLTLFFNWKALLFQRKKLPLALNKVLRENSNSSWAGTLVAVYNDASTFNHILHVIHAASFFLVAVAKTVLLQNIGFDFFVTLFFSIGTAAFWIRAHAFFLAMISVILKSSVQIAGADNVLALVARANILRNIVSTAHSFVPLAALYPWFPQPRPMWGGVLYLGSGTLISLIATTVTLGSATKIINDLRSGSQLTEAKQGVIDRLAAVRRATGMSTLVGVALGVPFLALPPMRANMAYQLWLITTMGMSLGPMKQSASLGQSASTTSAPGATAAAGTGAGAGAARSVATRVAPVSTARGRVAPRVRGQPHGGRYEPVGAAQGSSKGNSRNASSDGGDHGWVGDPSALPGGVDARSGAGSDGAQETATAATSGKGGSPVLANSSNDPATLVVALDKDEAGPAV